MSARMLIVLLVAAAGGVGSAWAQRMDAYPDPNDPDKTRRMVPRAERERLGLAAKTWYGVVQPEVYTALARLNQTVERLKKTNTVDAIRTRIGVRFEGSVYVQVLLKHDAKGNADLRENAAAIQLVQHRVLASLTAAEFHVQQLFERSAGLVGHVSAEGIDKLADHPDVAAVCLDDQPLPVRAPVVYGHQFQDPGPGEFYDEPGVRAGRVEAKVYEGLKQSDRLFVLVNLEPKGEPLPPLTDVPGEMKQRTQEREAAVRKLQDRILSTLTADDFWLETRFPLAPAFTGRINRAGLEKLSKHPEVKGIGLDQVAMPGWKGPCSGRPIRADE